MPRKTVFPVLLLLLAATPATAQQVYIDFDPGYDRDSVKTFAWLETPETSVAAQSSLMHSRIKNAMEHYLSQAGLAEVASDPDVYVTYHTDSEQEVAIDTTDWGYGYPGDWRWDPYWSGYWGGARSTTTTTVRSYTRGTLIIDVLDAATKQLVWRGSASAVVPDKPSKLEKMSKKWRKIEAKG